MKNVKLIVFAVIAMLFLGMGNIHAQEKEPQTVIIRAFEHHRDKSSQLVVTSPDGSTKSTKLTNVNLGTFEGNENNSIILQSEINNWKKQGFAIDGISINSNYVGAMVTIIILSKEN